MPDLKLERREQENKTPILGRIMVTPPIDEDYWAYRVKLTDTQAIVGFPKFSTIGIGFAQEEDWNTNLPYTSDAREIALHIIHNAGDPEISPYDVVDAIKLIQEAVRADRGEAAPAPDEYALSDRHVATILTALQAERDRLIDAGLTGQDCTDALQALYRGMTPDTHGLTYTLNNA